MRRSVTPKAIYIPAGTIVSAQSKDEDYVLTIPLQRGEYIKVSFSEEALRQLNLSNPTPSIL